MSVNLKRRKNDTDKATTLMTYLLKVITVFSCIISCG